MAPFLLLDRSEEARIWQNENSPKEAGAGGTQMLKPGEVYM